MTPRAAEGAAPCRVVLAGGAEGAVTVAVAIDRRPWCRVETGAEGVLLESRDTLRKASGGDVAEVIAKGTMAPVARVLRALGVESGLHVVTQSRVPEGSGLGEEVALGAAVAGAAARALERELSPEEIAQLGSEAETRGREVTGGLQAAFTAVYGGVVAVHAGASGPRAERLAVDPARIEESLLLVEATSPQSAAPAAVARDVAGRVLQALRDGRFEDVVALWAEEWDAREGGGPVPDRVEEVVREAGGALRAQGAGRVLAAWAPPGARGPGRREAVLAAAKAAGLRLFPARVDLRGLEVE
jgi:D-glycero-alpha-D-manno-heptose-7-phosphate kinase